MIFTDDLVVEAIDREITRGFRTLIFSPAVEQRFEVGRHRRRAQTFVLTGLVATCLYDGFLLGDAEMIPDVFGAAVIARLFIYTPLYALTAFVLLRSRSVRVREGTASALAVMAVLLIMAVLTMSRSPNAMMYQHGTLLIMLYSSLVLRLRFRYAVATLIASIAVQLVAGRLHA